MVARDRLDTKTALGEMRTKQRKADTANPLANASVGGGRLRFYAGGELLIEDGNLTVAGTAYIDGELIGTGTLTWSGAANISGPLTVTGVTKLNGDTTINGPSHIVGNQDITGTLAVKGVTTLSKDLNVVTGGIIKIGAGMQLEPFGAGGGAINFMPTGSIAAGSGSISIVAPDVTASLTVGGGGTQITGILTNPGTTTTSSAANAYIDPTTGRLYRNSSARRFKIRPRIMKVASALLDVPVKEWIDRGARERGEPDIHVPGIIAEEVNAAGGGQFITHGPDGELEGVAYDRLALARTQLLNDKLNAALKRIEKLETKLAAQR